MPKDKDYRIAITADWSDMLVLGVNPRNSGDVEKLYMPLGFARALAEGLANAVEAAGQEAITTILATLYNDETFEVEESRTEVEEVEAHGSARQVTALVADGLTDYEIAAHDFAAEADEATS